MRLLLLGAMALLAGCVADPERARGPDVGDTGGSEAGVSECRIRAERAGDARNVLIAQHLCWIEENSRYRNLQPPLFWVDLSKEEMAARRGNPSVGAFYTCGLNTMYLNKDWNARDAVQVSILLHELVHHAQCVSLGILRPVGAPPPGDTCAIEREAYALQAQYIRQLSGRAATSNERAFLQATAEQSLKTADQVCQRLGVS